MSGSIFVIEDEFHCEWLDGRYRTREAAIAELTRISAIPWGEAPNRPPCSSGHTCHRDYVVIEFDDSSEPWRRLSDEALLFVDANGAKWLTDNEGERSS